MSATLEDPLNFLSSLFFLLSMLLPFFNSRLMKAMCRVSSTAKLAKKSAGLHRAARERPARFHGSKSKFWMMHGARSLY